MILVLDNFDSFTYNLVDYIKQLQVECDVLRNNTPLEEIIKKKYTGIVLSPGPGTPEKAGVMMQVIENYFTDIPILGICLGHQALGKFYGGIVKRAKYPMHGKISEIHTVQDPIFENIPSSFNVVRYHSLILCDLPSDVKTIASSSEGEIMIIRHNKFPSYGIQYHPEAHLTEYGLLLMKNWIKIHKLV